MSTRRKARRKDNRPKRTAAKSLSMTASGRASIFRNGANQAVRLPPELRFPEEVKEVRVRKQRDSLVLSPIRPDWASFFALKVDVPDDFLADREDPPPQEREPL
ncbi:MAG TPA: type II toxin-antitoxin system VapB family antitoxin [Steroidobacteraceae bacterium]|nr:type II toxin-antitoxin system VapB family antitoxin [Steroidobacteraceae bacterium]